jgi:hypothetical protein
MHVVEVVAEDGRPPAGTRLRVEVRDTTYVDAAAPLVAEASGKVEPGSGPRLGSVSVAVPGDAPANLTVFAHVDVDGDGAISPGDWITMSAYSLRDHDAAVPLRVAVRPVR